MYNRHTWPLKKIKILGAILELPAKQHCQFSPFGPFSWWIGFMGTDYSIELISIETYAPQFIGHNKFFRGIVNKNANTVDCKSIHSNSYCIVSTYCTSFFNSAIQTVSVRNSASSFLTFPLQQLEMADRKQHMVKRMETQDKARSHPVQPSPKQK